MWKPIQIKPEDQSLVGRIVKMPGMLDYQAVEICYVGEKRIFTRRNTSEGLEEEVFGIRNDFLILEPDPQKVKIAQAVHKVFSGGEYCFCLTGVMYPSEEIAKRTLGTAFVSWPAIPNSEGLYEVPDALEKSN